MTGPRVSTGSGSKQDYQTPIELIKAVEKRFGPIQFDLAAHAGNAIHKRYFAPTHFFKTGTESEMKLEASLDPFNSEVRFLRHDKKKGDVWECKTNNIDPKAWGFEAFVHSWADLSKKFGFEKKSCVEGEASFRPGLLWNNCEFDDIKPWASKHAEESKQGSNTLLLTPASVGSNWARDYVYPYADVYLLNDRICFDGKNVYPKDCMLSHYHPGVKTYGAKIYNWSWVSDRIFHQWTRSK